MFWRKKKITAAPVEVSTAGTGTAAMGTAPATGSAAAPAATKAEKLPGPKFIPDILSDYLVRRMAKESGWVRGLSVLMRPRAGGEKGFDVRIFAEHEAATSRAKIKDYTTLDEHPNLILYEGWFEDKGWPRSPKVEVTKKRR